MPPGRERRFVRPCSIEILEDRLAPATYWWIGATSGAWNVAANWAASSNGTGTGAVPGAGDNAIFNASALVVNQISSFGANVTVNSVLFNSSTALSIGNIGSLTIVGNPTLNGGAFADGTSTDALAMGSASSIVSIAAELDVGAVGSGQGETWINNSSTFFLSTGTVRFNWPVTFSGATTAPMLLSSASGGAGFTVNGTWLQLGSLLTNAGPITLAAGKFSAGNPGQITITNAVTIAGNITLGDPTDGGINFAPGTLLTISGANDTIAMQGSCSFSGPISFVTPGSSTTFSISSNQLNGTSIGSSGLELNGQAHTLVLNGVVGNGNVTAFTIAGLILAVGLANAGTLILGGSSSVTVGSLIPAVTTPATPSNFSVVIDSVTTGSYLFNGSNTYTGGTTLLGGALHLPNANTGYDDTIATTLLGVTIESGALGVGPLTLSGGSLYLANAILNNDLVINGNVTFAGALGASGQTFAGNTTFAAGPGAVAFTNTSADFSGNVHIDNDFTVSGTLSNPSPLRGRRLGDLSRCPAQADVRRRHRLPRGQRLQRSTR